MQNIRFAIIFTVACFFATFQTLTAQSAPEKDPNTFSVGKVTYTYNPQAKQVTYHSKNKTLTYDSSGAFLSGADLKKGTNIASNDPRFTGNQKPPHFWMAKKKGWVVAQSAKKDSKESK